MNLKIHTVEDDTTILTIQKQSKENNETIIILAQPPVIEDVDVIHRSSFATWMLERQETWRKVS